MRDRANLADLLHCYRPQGS